MPEGVSETALVKAEATTGGTVIAAEDVEKLLMQGNLAALTPAARLAYYKRRCEDIGLDPLARPFDYLLLNGKLVLYANKGCFEQLRALRHISIAITQQKQIGDLFIVTAQAKLQDGRSDEDTGAVDISALQGEKAANAILKAITKAKRRVTLSICGLGMLDETEADSIPSATRIVVDSATGEVLAETKVQRGKAYVSTGPTLPGPCGQCDAQATVADHLGLYCPKHAPGASSPPAPAQHLSLDEQLGVDMSFLDQTEIPAPQKQDAPTPTAQGAVLALPLPAQPPTSPAAASITPLPGKTRKRGRKPTPANFDEWIARAKEIKGQIAEEDYYGVLAAHGWQHANAARDKETWKLLISQWREAHKDRLNGKPRFQANLTKGDADEFRREEINKARSGPECSQDPQPNRAADGPMQLSTEAISGHGGGTSGATRRPGTGTLSQFDHASATPPVTDPPPVGDMSLLPVTEAALPVRQVAILHEDGSLEFRNTPSFSETAQPTVSLPFSDRAFSEWFADMRRLFRGEPVRFTRKLAEWSFTSLEDMAAKVSAQDRQGRLEAMRTWCA